MRLRELRDFMKGHFAKEAAGGYLEEAVVRVPRLAAEADTIEGQHPGLLREINGMLEKMAKAEPTAEAWRNGDAVAAFAAALLCHETAENRILQQGFNEDPALFDLDS